jgi:hypothetical protein
LTKIKSKSLSIAVLAFFVVAILSFFAGCTPDICCGRALLGGVGAYCVASWALRMISNILYDALTGTKQTNNQKVNYVGTDADGQHG